MKLAVVLSWDSPAEQDPMLGMARRLEDSVEYIDEDEDDTVDETGDTGRIPGGYQEDIVEDTRQQVRPSHAKTTTNNLQEQEISCFAE